MIMGGGKSSVITPLNSAYLTYHGKTIIIIVLKSLKNETFKIFCNTLRHSINVPIKMLSCDNLT